MPALNLPLIARSHLNFIELLHRPCISPIACLLLTLGIVGVMGLALSIRCGHTQRQ